MRLREQRKRLRAEIEEQKRKEEDELQVTLGSKREIDRPERDKKVERERKRKEIYSENRKGCTSQKGRKIHRK